MSPKIPDQPGATYYIDYRPAKCRCGREVLPHQLKCPNCGRRQTLLFQGLDRLYEDDIEGLIGTLERMAQKSPNDAMLLNQLAGAYLLNGDYGKARGTYQKAVAIDPLLAEAHLNLGGVLAFLGEKDAALKELKEYVRLDLHSPRVERALRAISTLEGIPYEDVLAETGMKGKPVRPDKAMRGSRSAHDGDSGTIESRMGRGRMYSSVRRREVSYKPIRKLPFGIFDIILWAFALFIIAAWFLLPVQVHGFIDNALADMETRYMFHDASGDLPGTPIFEEIAVPEEGEEGEEQPPGAIINENPETDSYYPLARNNRWEYASWDSTSRRGEGQRMNESTVVVRVTGMSNTILGIWRILNGSDTLFLTEKDDGVYSVMGPTGPMAGKITQVPYPVEVGATRDERGQRLVVEAEEFVETSMGIFRCVRIHYYLEEPIGTEWFAWYAQGVGVVKYVGGGREGIYHARELRSYELH